MRLGRQLRQLMEQSVPSPQQNTTLDLLIISIACLVELVDGQLHMLDVLSLPRGKVHSPCSWPCRQQKESMAA